MIEILNSWDISIFTILNSLHNPYLDNLMWLFSGKFTWIPMYLAIIIVMLVKDWKQGIIIILLSILCILIADQLSSSIIKPFAERLRPSHNPELLSTIHTVNGYMGSQYGFVSSHAANTFGFILLLSLIFKQKLFSIAGFSWATLVAYSRLYLGVHYFGDLLGGAIIGIFAGIVCYTIYCGLIKRRWPIYYSFNEPLPKKLSTIAISAIIINILAVAIISIFML